MSSDCVFCAIVAGGGAHRVYEDEHCLAFLDRRPVFKGHTLVVPKQHLETLADLPDEMLGPLFGTARLLSKTMVKALDAHGSFVGINNVVSQSVPHLHVHVIPRRFKDGLRGFFWPRIRYDSEDEAAAIAAVLRNNGGPG